MKSIEKLFSVLKREFSKKAITCRSFENPFPLKNMLMAILYFRKRQGDINHIVGDIHWAALLLDKNKTLLTIHDLDGLERLKGMKKCLYYYLWFYLPIKKLKYISVVSAKTKNEILALIPCAKDKILIINNCLTVQVNKRPLRAKISKLLIVGTRNNKNIERIFEAIAPIDIKLTIVGELTNEQEELALKYNLDFKNCINISDENLLDEYDLNDILCFPSTYEGFGLPILEAQARGCLVVTSKISPMNEVAGRGALLVDPFDMLSIRNSIQQLINDLQLRNSLQKKGYENVEIYSPEKISQQYLDLYQKIYYNDISRRDLH